MHNAVGTLIAAAIPAVGCIVIAAIKPARHWVWLLLSDPIPVWLALLGLLTVLAPVLWWAINSERKRKSASEEQAQKLKSASEELTRIAEEKKRIEGKLDHAHKQLNRPPGKATWVQGWDK